MRQRLSPGRALMLLGGGHVGWALVAYGGPLRELVRAGVADSVGDGIFRTEHARDERAAAFWFLFAAPLIGLSGYLADAAARAGDGRAVTAAGGTILGLSAAGTVVVPRSGFPVAVPIGIALIRRGRRLSRGRVLPKRHGSR